MPLRHETDRERRVVVTGYGCISALGLNADAGWDSASHGRTGISIRTVDAGSYGPEPHVTPLATVAEDYRDDLERVLAHRVQPLDPFVLFALKATFEALEHAGLLMHESLDRRTAIVFGQGNGGTHTLERAYERFYGMRSARSHPLTIPRIMVSAPASAIAMEFGVRGPAFAVSSACSSSGHAIAQGAELILSGRADVAIVGGSEAIGTPGSLRAWDALQAVSTSTCRPFSKGRDGMVIGEGGAALILESLDHARMRGATIHGELCGIGMTSDAFHWTQPSPEGAISAMTDACRQAAVDADEILLIAAHGTGTQLNDKNEAHAIHEVFGDRWRTHPVIATKSAHGHLIGASTALQAVIGLQALRQRVAPPILGYLGFDEECDLNLVIDQPQPIACDVLLLNSFAFGGLNTSIVFRSAPALN